MKRRMTTRLLVLSALLAAMSIVLSRFCVIWITPSVRISFGNIPIMLAGLLFGPVPGALVGAVADIVGAAALSPYGWYPPLTVGPVLIGLLSGFFRKPVRPEPKYLKTAAMTLGVNAVASMAYTSIILSGYNGTPLGALLIVRVPLYIGISLVEALVLTLLLRSPVKKYGEELEK